MFSSVRSAPSSRFLDGYQSVERLQRCSTGRRSHRKSPFARGQPSFGECRVGNQSCFDRRHAHRLKSKALTVGDWPDETHEDANDHEQRNHQTVHQQLFEHLLFRWSYDLIKRSHGESYLHFLGFPATQSLDGNHVFDLFISISTKVFVDLYAVHPKRT